MTRYPDGDRQLALIMFQLAELVPGSVCMDTTCPMGPVPHMANDSGNHPDPAGLIPAPWRPWRRGRV